MLLPIILRCFRMPLWWLATPPHCYSKPPAQLSLYQSSNSMGIKSWCTRLEEEEPIEGWGEKERQRERERETARDSERERMSLEQPLDNGIVFLMEISFWEECYLLALIWVKHNQCVRRCSGTFTELVSSDPHITPCEIGIVPILQMGN